MRRKHNYLYIALERNTNIQKQTNLEKLFETQENIHKHKRNIIKLSARKKMEK